MAFLVSDLFMDVGKNGGMEGRGDSFECGDGGVEEREREGTHIFKCWGREKMGRNS